MQRMLRLGMRLIGTDFCGNDCPPPDNWVLRFGPPRERGSAEKMHVAAWRDDGFNLFLGGPEHWDCFYSYRDARRLAWWIILCWARTGFGLRRWLYYRLLHASVAAQKRATPRQEPKT